MPKATKRANATYGQGDRLYYISSMLPFKSNLNIEPPNPPSLKKNKNRKLNGYGTWTTFNTLVIVTFSLYLILT